MKLTNEEKNVILRYLTEDMSFKGAMKMYWPWLLPFLVTAAHGIFYKNIISSSIANVLFLIYTYWFFSQGSIEGQHLKSAIQKYESEVSALGE